MEVTRSPWAPPRLCAGTLTQDRQIAGRLRVGGGLKLGLESTFGVEACSLLQVRSL